MKFPHEVAGYIMEAVTLVSAFFSGLKISKKEETIGRKFKLKRVLKVIWPYPVITVISGLVAIFFHYKAWDANRFELAYLRDSVNVYQEGIYERQRLDNATTENLEVRKLPFVNGDYTIHIGSGEVQSAPHFELYHEGYAVRLGFYNSPFDAPILQIVNGQLMLTWTIRGEDGMPVMQIRNNNWTVNPGEYHKRNFDSRGIEVTDKELITRLQIDFINDSVLWISGLFKTPNTNQYTLVNDNGINFYQARKDPFGNIDKSWLVLKSAQIKPIFDAVKRGVRIPYPQRHVTDEDIELIMPLISKKAKRFRVNTTFSKAATIYKYELIAKLRSMGYTYVNDGEENWGGGEEGSLPNVVNYGNHSDSSVFNVGVRGFPRIKDDN